MRRPRSQGTTPTRQNRAKLLESIEEYLSQDDKYGSFTPRRFSLGLNSVSDGDCLDISAIFDEHNDKDTSGFNSRNASSAGLSELESCIFASGDVQGSRHLGNIAISDFGNSRYGPGFHGLDIYALSGQSCDNIDSTDTLPEYMFREELPPPYLSFEDTSHIGSGYSCCNWQFPDDSRATISRPHAPVRQRPSSWRDYTDDETRDLGRPYARTGRNDHSRLYRSNSASHRELPPISGGPRSTTRGEVDFRFFPRNIG
ncbi:hypothetical protein GGI22_002410 [Coemansia erecta]|nr:hypothetical protein GGI22_002410 [Coemansia erecta]